MTGEATEKQSTFKWPESVLLQHCVQLLCPHCVDNCGYVLAKTLEKQKCFKRSWMSGINEHSSLISIFSWHSCPFSFRVLVIFLWWLKDVSVSCVPFCPLYLKVLEMEYLYLSTIRTIPIWIITNTCLLSLLFKLSLSVSMEHKSYTPA